MAIKTWTAGEVVTANDTNAYLTNSGLVYVASYTLTESTGDLTMGPFSSTYTNYRVIIEGLQSTVQGVMGVYVGSMSTGTSYYSSFYYDNANGAVSGYIRGNGTAYWGAGLTEIGVSSNYTFDICSPQKADRTSMMGTYNGRTVYAGFMGGGLANTTQYTQLGFFVPGGSMTAGTFTIYGYRKP